MRNYIVILCLSSSSSRDGNDKKPFKQTRSSDYPQVSSSPSNQSYRRCTHGVPRAGRLIAATAPHNAAGSCCNHRKEKTALRELVVEKAIMKTTINSPMSFRRKIQITFAAGAASWAWNSNRFALASSIGLSVLALPFSPPGHFRIEEKPTGRKAIALARNNNASKTFCHLPMCWSLVFLFYFSLLYVCFISNFSSQFRGKSGCAATTPETVPHWSGVSKEAGSVVGFELISIGQQCFFFSLTSSFFWCFEGHSGREEETGN